MLREEIIDSLKKDLSEMKSKQKKWLKQASKEMSKIPSYESPRLSSHGFGSEIVDLQLAIATLTDFDITKSILPQNKGEIIYSLEKDPINITYVKDKPLSSDRFDYAFSNLPLANKLGFSIQDNFKEELHKAIFSRDKEKVAKIFEKYEKKLQEILEKNNKETER